MTDEKLKFTLQEPESVILDFPKTKSKLTPKIKCEIALDILSKLDIVDLATYFNPPYNLCLQGKIEEAEKEAKPANENDEGPEVA